MEDITPSQKILIQDMDTLKVLADPLRRQILEVLAPQQLTITQIAEKLGMPSSKLYYHVNLLEKHNFVRIVDTTVKANLIEKHYWISAYEWDLADHLRTFATPEGQESVTKIMLAPIEATRDDIVRSLNARTAALEQGVEEHPREVVIYRELRNLSDERANKFIERLNALTQDFESLESEELKGDVETRALTIAFYPSFYYTASLSDEGDNEIKD